VYCILIIIYRGISVFKKGYQPRTNIVKNEKGDLVADCHSILTRWRNYFSQLLNVPGDNEIHTAEPLVPEPSALERFLGILTIKSCRNACTAFVYNMCLSTDIKGNDCIGLLISFPKERTVSYVIKYNVHSAITFVIIFISYHICYHIYKIYVTIRYCQMDTKLISK
jgi:hypothetical protein